MNIALFTSAGLSSVTGCVPADRRGQPHRTCHLPGTFFNQTLLDLLHHVQRCTRTQLKVEIGFCGPRVLV